MNYGKRLKQLREANNISIYRLSKNSTISSSHINDIEKDKNQPTIETLIKLLAPMGITLSEFFNKDGEVSYLNERERELVENYRTMPDAKADLYFQLGKALNQEQE